MDASRKSKIPEDNTNNRPSTSTGNSTNPIDKNANIAHSQSFSKNEHIVIIQANDEISVTESIAAIQTFFNQSNIRFEPRISKIEISLYLSDKKQEESIREALEKNTMGHNLLTKPSVQEAKRIILSGIESTIPDREVLKKLKSMKITPVSQITSIFDLGRQVYIRSEDIKELSDHITIDYENRMHSINIRSDNSTILIMDKNGLQENLDMQHIVSTQSANEDICTTDGSNVLEKNIEGTKQTLPINSSSKTSSSKNQISNSLNSDEESNPSVIESIKKSSGMQTKKTVSKCKEDLDYDEILLPIRATFELKPNPYIFNYDKLKEFLKATKNKRNILPIVCEFTKNLTSEKYDAITQMLLYIKEHITERNMNNRIKLLLKNLNIEWKKRKKKSSSKAKNKLKDRREKSQSSRKKQKKSVGIKTNPNIVNKISITIGGSDSTKK